MSWNKLKGAVALSVGTPPSSRGSARGNGNGGGARPGSSESGSSDLDFKNQAHRLRQELAQARTDLKSEKAQSAEHEATIKGLEDMLAGMTEAMAAEGGAGLGADTGAADHDAEAAHAEVLILKTQLSNVVLHAQHLEAQLQASTTGPSNEQIKAMRHALEAADARVEQAEAACAAAQAEAAASRGAVAASKTASSGHAHTISAMSGLMHETMETNAATIAELEAKVEDGQVRLGAVTRELEEALEARSRPVAAAPLSPGGAPMTKAERDNLGLLQKLNEREAELEGARREVATLQLEAATAQAALLENAALKEAALGLRAQLGEYDAMKAGTEALRQEAAAVPLLARTISALEGERDAALSSRDAADAAAADAAAALAAAREEIGAEVAAGAAAEKAALVAAAAKAEAELDKTNVTALREKADLAEAWAAARGTLEAEAEGHASTSSTLAATLARVEEAKARLEGASQATIARLEARVQELSTDMVPQLEGQIAALAAEGAAKDAAIATLEGNQTQAAAAVAAAVKLQASMRVLRGEAQRVPRLEAALAVERLKGDVAEKTLSAQLSGELNDAAALRTEMVPLKAGLKAAEARLKALRITSEADLLSLQEQSAADIAMLTKASNEAFETTGAKVAGLEAALAEAVRNGDAAAAQHERVEKQRAEHAEAATKARAHAADASALRLAAETAVRAAEASLKHHKELVAKHETEHHATKQELAAQMTDLATGHAEKLAAAAAGHAEALTEHRETSDRALLSAKEEHERAVAEHREQHAWNVAIMTDQHATAVQDVRTEHEATKQEHHEHKAESHSFRVESVRLLQAQRVELAQLAGLFEALKADHHALVAADAARGREVVAAARQAARSVLVTMVKERGAVAQKIAGMREEMTRARLSTAHDLSELSIAIERETPERHVRDAASGFPQLGSGTVMRARPGGWSNGSKADESMAPSATTASEPEPPAPRVFMSASAGGKGRSVGLGAGTGTGTGKLRGGRKRPMLPRVKAAAMA